MGSIDSGEVQELYSACGLPRAWSPDGAILLYTDGPDLWSLAFPGGARRLLFKRQGYTVEDVGFSPDGSWVAMVLAIEGKPKLQGVLSPFDHLSEENRWITIIEEDYHLALKWAAEGNIVYYLSRRDDFRCLYGQRLRNSDKRPIDLPIAIRHFHSYRNYPNAGSPIAVALDKVMLRLTTRKSNVWAMDLRDAGR